MAIEKLHHAERHVKRNLVPDDRRIRLAVIDLRAVDGDRITDEREIAHRGRHHPEEASRRRHDQDAFRRGTLQRRAVGLGKPLLGIKQRPVEVQRDDADQSFSHLRRSDAALMRMRVPQL